MRKWLRKLLCRYLGHRWIDWEVSIHRWNRKRPKKKFGGAVNFTKCSRCGVRRKNV